ncbi:hypothetical protein KQI52_16035 [bacterium]|nr:hypothetical protein [bacterium]
MRSHLHLRHSLLLAVSLTLASLFMLAGCVTVQPDKAAMEINDLPPEHAALFFAVTLDNLNLGQMEVVFNDSLSIVLRAKTINRVYLPEGWYTMSLPRLPQRDDNAEMMYRFSAGDLYRFTLLERLIVGDDSTAAPEKTYTLAPSTRDAFQQLLLQEEYPVVNLVPTAK